ncbi:MAG: plasmid replication protein RepC [Hyphomicrobium sp.]
MNRDLPTTPFGRRPLSLAMVATQVTAKATPPEVAVHKWQIYRAICEAKTAIGVTDRALAVLNALLTFHPETVLTSAPRRAAGDETAEESSGLIVFPSNHSLTLRAHGMAPATLRRHLAVLVHCGLVIRRDSPNGKRYARKGQGGAIETAFGFDLTPLVARAAEFECLAEEARGERRAYLVVREGITLVRRDIVKMIDAGVEEGVPADWRALHEAYAALARRIPRTATRSELEPLLDELTALAERIRKVLETHVNSQNKSANESHSERHIQNSNTNLNESETAFQPSRDEVEPRSAVPNVRQGPNSSSDRTQQTQQRRFPLGMVLKACPDVVDYARHGSSSWREFVATAGLVRSALGISPSAWEDACAVLGEEDAAVVVAAILQRAEAINSPGGYLRSLTDKARAGQFSTGPVLMSLLRTHMNSRRNAS